MVRRMQKISYSGYRFPPEIIQQASPWVDSGRLAPTFHGGPLAASNFNSRRMTLL